MLTSGALMKPETTAESDRAKALAGTLDCLTEEDLCALYNIQPSTAENWRKRGKGPAYILAGNRYLYPRSSVASDLEARIRTRSAPPARGCL